MKELTYAILELEEWNNRGTCYFCYNSGNKAVCQIRVRSKATDRIIQNSKACEVCKEKLNELQKCNSCGRLKTKSRFHSGKYVCDCEKYQESQEKELPVLPHERRPGAFYERQINSLQEELSTAEVEIDTHLEALETAEDWHKRQKQELLDRIKELEAEVERLKKQTPQALVDEIENLKNQLEQQNAQIEVKETKKWSWKLKK